MDYKIWRRKLSQGELIQTLNNVMFYCSLQILSLVLLAFILQKKLGLSPMHQLAFVLEKQAPDTPSVSDRANIG